MIYASFDEGRSAAVTHAYQYDTGQRIALLGLPTPQEMGYCDAFLSGDEVAVQVQYARASDSQTEMRLGAYDFALGAWVAAVPDAMLRTSEDVRVFVYVTYGQTEESSRAKTMYEAVFRPIARPAPGDTVTPDQENAWDALVQEVNLTLSGVGTAISGANAAAAEAKDAAGNAQEAAEDAQSAAQEARETGKRMQDTWQGATASAVTLQPGAQATVSLTEKSGVKHFEYGIPAGEKGETGPQGPKGDTGPAGVTFTLVDTVLYITTDDA